MKLDIDSRVGDIENSVLYSAFDGFKQENLVFQDEEITFSGTFPCDIPGRKLSEKVILGWGKETNFGKMPGRNTFHYDLESGKWTFAGFAYLAESETRENVNKALH